VELRDAGHLWGKDTQETRRIIRSELKNADIQVACIGLAGENKVLGATIESSVGASASRGGPGAVMGDKNLKAIAVLGTGDVKIARTARLIELCEQIVGRSGTLRRGYENLAHGLNQSEVTGGYYGNLNDGYRDLPRDSEFRQAVKSAGDKCQDLLDRAGDRELACYNCAVRCRRAVRRPDGRYNYLKCESWWSFVVASRIVDYDFALACFSLCQDYGLDSVSVARYVAFAIDLYQNGILTRDQADGMCLEWGNKEVVLSLIEKIARREGIGDTLANGVAEAARQIGRGAEQYAHHTKKLEYVPLSTCVHTPYYALAQAISDKSDFTRNVSAVTQGTWFQTRERKEEFLRTEFFTYPRGFEKHIMDDFDRAGHDCEGGCQMAAYDEENFTITDITGLCNNWSGFFGSPPINSRVLMAELVSCTTGLDISEAELTQIARRVINLVRAANVRFGARRQDDAVSTRFQRKAPAPWVSLDPDIFNKWLDRFYELRGWNREGIPAGETLEKLGLDYVRQDLERRRILTDLR
jgi:aldehyde:ferredoxin oxidoreductase